MDSYKMSTHKIVTLVAKNRFKHQILTTFYQHISNTLNFISLIMVQW